MLARNPAQTSSRDVSTTVVLRRDQRGGVAAIIAFATIPMIAAAGLAADGLLAMLARPELSSAVDAGALAGARGYPQANLNAQDANVLKEMKRAGEGKRVAER